MLVREFEVKAYRREAPRLSTGIEERRLLDVRVTSGQEYCVDTRQ